VSALQPGDLVAGRYRVVRKVAAGGMATIYEAQTEQGGETVALKIPHESFRQDRGALKRFQREARAAMAIKSPHVVRTLSVGKLANDMPFMVMEYVDGTPLRDLLYDPQGNPQPMGLETTLSIVDQIAAAVSAAHEVSVIHRDIKPDNVLISFDGQNMMARVFDFGLSRLAVELSVSRLTAPGITFGTPQYMAPEQARSAGAADERTDIYAMGVIVYEMLSTHLPYEGDTAAEVWRSITKGDPVPLRAHRPDLPARLSEVVMQALARDPARRFASAAAFREALASTRPLVAPKLPAARAAHRRGADGRVVALGVTMAVLILGLIAAMIVMSQR
jgi:eukaryotic-like serine/threonine-protein kinase